MASILIVPIPPVDDAAVEALISPLRAIFPMSVELLSGRTLNPTPSFDIYRNQYNSTTLLSMLLQAFPDRDGKLLGVTGLDLFIPVLTYVFGEAQLDGTAAVVSGHRLDDRLFGLAENRPLFLDRLVKEAVHELGHTFGLYHCREPECVMRSSTATEEIDLKNRAFCANCEAIIASRARSG